MSESPIITYTNLLQKYRDANAPEVKAFFEDHKHDDVFVRRAQALNALFRLKETLVVPVAQ